MTTFRRVAASFLITAVLLSAAAAQPTDPAAASAPAAPSPAGAAGPAATGTASGGLKAWVQSHPRSTKDAIAGAIGGALLGGLLGKARGGSFVKSALIGAAAGGIGGYFLGRSQDRVQADRDEAVRAAAYDPSQGYLLRLDEINLEPAAAAPGGEVTLSIRYVVISPDPRERITVNCFRGIQFQGNYLSGDGPSSLVIRAGGGIVSSSSTIKLPQEAPAGSYAIEEVIEDRDGRFQQTVAKPLYITAANG